MMAARRVCALWMLPVVCALAPLGCGASQDSRSTGRTSEDQSRGATGMNTTNTATTIEVRSSAFANGQPIPRRHTGDGEDISPALEWSAVPAGTQELAMIVDDPDAPGGTWVHWVIYKIPASTTGLPEGIPRQQKLSQPDGALQGRNSWPTDNIGYRGPQPPPGHGVHHYHFKLFALDTVLDVKPGIDKKALTEAMKNHILAQGETIGTYKR